MKQTTFVLCDSLNQANNVLEVIIQSQMRIEAEISEIGENGQRWIKIRYETGADLLILGMLLGRETDLYKH